MNILLFDPKLVSIICDNNDVRTIMLWECDPGVREACGQPREQCSRLLVIWTPGSRGEMLPVSSGIELRGGRLRLEITYNPGTGWLYDSSGIELFYSSEKNLKKVKEV